VTKTASNRLRSASPPATSEWLFAPATNGDYFRIRDFEYVQPLYDLAFLLEVGALARGVEVPKYRTFSLWRAAYSLDGYGTTIDRWLDGTARDEDLDYVPSSRIRQYLTNVGRSGTIPELRAYRSERFDRCLRLRSIRGLGPAKIAQTVSLRTLNEQWFRQDPINLAPNRDRITGLCNGSNIGPWQTAHIVPPLLRFLNTIQEFHGQPLGWDISGIADPFVPVTDSVRVAANGAWDAVSGAIAKTLKREKHFRRDSQSDSENIRVRHQMGWTFVLHSHPQNDISRRVSELAEALDPLASNLQSDLHSDLHLHTAWSDGSASVNTMATAVVASGLKHFAVTDHSRTAKLQDGLTPPLWLRQANALTLATPVCPILHGIEVDILKDGALDLPQSLLAGADLVVGSVHSSWTDDRRTNTNRLVTAIESGCIDILAHPTSAIIGKPGVPDYVRPPADVNWNEVFEKCALWSVALELNCFPSRLDLPLDLLRNAIDAGCAISIGSDAHARSHLLNLRFGAAALRQLEAPVVLNRLQHDRLKQWIAESRAKRTTLTRSTSVSSQTRLQFEDITPKVPTLTASIQPPRNIPSGSRVVGIDLTAGDKATGIAILDGCTVETCSLFSDEEILSYVRQHTPKVVSIDSPLGLPGGGASIDPKAGIMRVAEYDLTSIGIPAYPSLIDSMENLTLRGIRLRRAIEGFPRGPRVIESYPGAAQDILCIPRKQRSLDLLREGLRRLGLRGSGLETRSHDEMDAITSAIVGRYFEVGAFEPMGVPLEAQLIVPKVRPLLFDTNPVICLAGKTGAGKSVIARYLSVFYGFEWIRTRNLIRQLLVDDIAAPTSKKLFHRQVNPDSISELDLREFGAVILDVHKQVPLRKRLTKTMKRYDAPTVVDSIRDTVDVDLTSLGGRPVITWFVDCDDSIIQHRLLTKRKLGDKRPKTGSPVDRTAQSIRSKADDIISNNRSLEDLRWSVDDALFSITRLRT